MGANPLFTLGATYTAGAGAGEGAGLAAAAANPYVDAAALAAAAAAYGFSPSVRNMVNPWIKKGYESITNPFQHLGDGSSKDKFGNILRGTATGGSPGFLNGLDGTLDPTNSQNGFMKNLLGQAKDSTQQQQQNKNPFNSQSNSYGEPIPPHQSPIANLPSWAPNPDVSFYQSPMMPQRSFY